MRTADADGLDELVDRGTKRFARGLLSGPFKSSQPCSIRAALTNMQGPLATSPLGKLGRHPACNPSQALNVFGLARPPERK
eukprot:15435177-Alexandrium_andersonii.AAC.1